MERLAQLHCQPCARGTAPLRGAALMQLHAELSHGWQLVAGPASADAPAPRPAGIPGQREPHHLYKEFHFPDFVTALAFVNQVGALAEEQNHHPDLHLGWGRVGIAIWTHTIDGLSESDFVLAARIEQLHASSGPG
jgi:4a-hydroxytetrahydrobiopterin dehydratase